MEREPEGIFGVEVAIITMARTISQALYGIGRAKKCKVVYETAAGWVRKRAGEFRTGTRDGRERR